MAIRTYDVLGVTVHAVDLADAVATIHGLAANQISDGAASYVCVRDVNGIVECQRNPTLRAVHRQAAMVTADGMPVVWWGRAHGYKEARRVYGPDLMAESCRTSALLGLKHFLCGGGEGVAASLADCLVKRFPGLNIVGILVPPFRPLDNDDYRALAAEITASGADIIWVGLGSPKQELFMAELAVHLRRGVLVGVGAAFDFLSGRKPQAPIWIQRSGFEWLFRLATEPRRLWKRYSINNSLFVILTARYLASTFSKKFLVLMSVER